MMIIIIIIIIILHSIRPTQPIIVIIIITIIIIIIVIVAVVVVFVEGRYSDSQRAGGSGDQIPVQLTLSAPVQTGPGAHPASCTMGAGCFQEVKRRGVAFTAHPIYSRF
jgi:hypothetical protein